MTSPSTDTDEQFDRAAALLLDSAPSVLRNFSGDGVHADLFLSATSNRQFHRASSRHGAPAISFHDARDFAAALNVIRGDESFLGVFDPLRPGALEEAADGAISMISARGGSLFDGQRLETRSLEDISEPFARQYLDELYVALRDLPDVSTVRLTFDARDRRRLVVASLPIIEQSQQSTCRVIVDARITGTYERHNIRHVVNPFTATSESVVREMAEHIASAREARPLHSGMYRVLFGAGWAGTWVHEVVGHMLEADIFFDGPLREMLGKAVMPSFVNVTNAPGEFLLDDEGTPSTTTHLVADGVLAGVLADQRTAHRFAVNPTGSGYRASARHAPIPRMSTLKLAPGEGTAADFISGMSEGLLIDDCRGARVLPAGNVCIVDARGYRVEAGRCTHRVSGLTIRGSVIEWLRGLAAVGDDVIIDTTRGLCVKKAQAHQVVISAPSTSFNALAVQQS